MMVSTMGRYALRVMIDLAGAPDRWIHSTERNCVTSKHFREISRKHYQVAREEQYARWLARQRRRPLSLEP